MTHTALPPLAPPQGPRPPDAAPRGGENSAIWRQAARQPAPSFELPQRADERAAVTPNRRNGSGARKMVSQTSLPSLTSSQGQSIPLRPVSSSIPRDLPAVTVGLHGGSSSVAHAVSALQEEEFHARIAIATVEGINRLTFDLVKTRSEIAVLEEPAARRQLTNLFHFGSCQVRLTQILKIQAWWRLLLRNNKSWHNYAHSALRVWHRRSSSATSQSTGASNSCAVTPRAPGQQSEASRRSSGVSSTSSAGPTPSPSPEDIAAALVRLEQAATSPLRYNIMMDEYLYSLRERANILLLLERRRSVNRHKKLYYAYVNKCLMGIPEDNAAWQDRFVAEMFVAIVHFKSLPWGWRTRYSLPYPAWRALRWRTPRIATPPAPTEQQRRNARLQFRAAMNDMASLHDHERLAIISEEKEARKALETQFTAARAPEGTPERPPPRPASTSPVPRTSPPKPLDQTALTPSPPARSARERTLPPLRKTPTRRPRTTQPTSVRRSLVPSSHTRPAWSTLPRNSTPTKVSEEETGARLALSRLRREENDARLAIENHEYDARYRTRWAFGNTGPDAAS